MFQGMGACSAVGLQLSLYEVLEVVRDRVYEEHSVLSW